MCIRTTKNDVMTRKTKIVLGICGAIVAAAVITALVAPEETKKVTKRVKKEAGKWVDQLGNIFSKATEQHIGDLREKAHRVKNLVS
jgi:gas vesicle protein